MKGWPYGRDACRTRTRAEVNRRGGWRRRSGCGREGSHVERRAGIVEGCGRVRGIVLNLRFIWIGLFIAGCHEYLSTRPRPEVRFLFPPLVYYKNDFFEPLPFPLLTQPWTGPANTISLYDSSRSKLGCAVLVVCLSTFFFFFFLGFILFHICTYFLFVWNAIHWGALLTVNEKPQPIVDQSTLRPSYNYASLTRPGRTFLRPLLRPRHNITRNSPPTPMDTPTSLPGPWTRQCSLQLASVPGRSSRTRTISCLRASPSPTMTRSCIG